MTAPVFFLANNFTLHIGAVSLDNVQNSEHCLAILQHNVAIPGCASSGSMPFFWPEVRSRACRSGATIPSKSPSG